MKKRFSTRQMAFWRGHRRRRGQAMVEMAIVIGVLLLVILGGLDCLQLAMTNYTVSQAVRAAAHQAALVGGPDGQNGGWGESASAQASGTVAATARTILDSGMVTNAEHATITATCAASPCRRYSAITVRITYSDGVWAPFPGVFSTIEVAQSATRAAEKDTQADQSQSPVTPTPCPKSTICIDPPPGYYQ